MSDATLSSPGLNRTSRPDWQSGVLESLVMLGIALAVDQAFFKGDRFWTVQPHPFWVPVLLVAVQHGTNAGLLAAGAATAALLIGNLPPQGIDQDYYAYLFEITWQPLLWMAAALILGELRTRQVRDR
jgi:polysaccharide biosynthesis protein PelD